MRFLVFSLTLMSSVSTFACPQLEGQYKNCFSNLTQERLKAGISISQKIVNKVTRYTFTSVEQETEKNVTEEYVADGKLRSISETDSDTGIKIKTTTRATCIDNSLVVDTKATIANEVMIELKTKNTLSGNKLVQELNGMTMGEEIKEIITCEN